MTHKAETFVFTIKVALYWLMTLASHQNKSIFYILAQYALFIYCLGTVFVNLGISITPLLLPVVTKASGL